MKSFEYAAAQGDVMFVRVGELPEGLEEAPLEDGELVVAHSETGHHHVMVGNAKMYGIPGIINQQFLKINEPSRLVHRREYHTHEELLFRPGVYQVLKQREFDIGSGMSVAVLD